MATTRRTLSVAAIGIVFLAAACKDRETIRVQSNTANLARRDTTRKLGPGDLRIATTDSAVEVALIGDSLVAGLGARTRAKIRTATDTALVGGSGVAASLEKMVKSTVAGALDHEIHMPLTEISNIEYENGMLVFYGKDGKRMHVFERSGSNGARSQFSQDDATDFIAVFKAKTGRG